ncbi:uroporphyrinogen decarboxylase [Pelagibacterium xiamenense]|uniref:uroporphyrinogen decarboxylase n=1 Tax=Pelagibacterium xiamenense TaxID=2901140 RepID=UPI001E5F08D0|nr:uroporphyrinogen decarboxylase [Pelagibacterium xiamenense]MCD7058427.1 uroporphyrinogen decarboxylase [Pelagibacterium xiamenense]
MPITPTGKPLLDAALGIRQEKPPVWIMRQAGRYLPEYRAVREKAGGFLDLCFNPDFATEVSLQPLRRFDLDAAILFSDILVIPHALGQPVRFAAGEGPLLEPLDANAIDQLTPETALEQLEPVFEAVSRIKSALADDKTLIGFCGAPWTVATYMLGGKGSPDQAAARLFALQHPEAFAALIDILVEVSARYLIAQFRAGADIVQIFESWALNLDEDAFVHYVLGPNARIVERVRADIPDAPIIGFPRGAAGMIGRYATETGVNVLGLDFSMPVGFANKMLPETLTVQGNLDPLRVVAGGKQMEDRARAIVDGFKNRPHIFNLGHGITPQTPIEHVEVLIRAVKQ